VQFIPEIVINGLSLKAVKKAMKVGIKAVLDDEDVLGVSAGNYGGQLGEHQIHLGELFP
jgi:formylmethanofuran--tetrahydromethanopterin N-formyltransferase